MAPITQASDETNHQALLDKLDLFGVARPFRNPNWKPPQRRNKNIKQIISEAQRKEASMMPSQINSGASTPLPDQTDSSATETNGHGGNKTISQATQRLDRLVLERNLEKEKTAGTTANFGPAVTYMNVESAPSLHPSSQRRYCDITGLPASYTDPKSRLRYHNMEVFAVIRTMGQSTAEGYLAARGAHTVLK